jgi:hypothetical protein
MPWRRALVVVLACLAWGAASPTVACNQHASAAGEVAPASKPVLLAKVGVNQTLPTVEAAPQMPASKCPGACFGACCCHGGMTSCSAGHISGPATVGFDLFRSARGSRLAWGGDQSVPYRDPRYGLDRPPKA